MMAYVVRFEILTLPFQYDLVIWGCDAVLCGLVVLDISKDCITFIFKGEGVLLDSLTHEDEGTTFL